MRLIDAEAFYKAVEKEKRMLLKNGKTSDSSILVGGLQMVLKWINEQPTIEAKPVVHAHWDKDRNCTNCGRTYMDIAIAVWEDFSESEGDIPSWCPYCGAQMDEVVE